MSSRRTISNTFTVTTMDDPVSVQAQYSPDKTVVHTVWQAGDLYMRTRESDSSAWSSWHKIVGERGDETDYTFNISKSLTSSNATTAPANCYYNTWQDAPIAPTSTYPYLWMKIVKKTWNESTQSYDSGTARYARVTGEKGENAFVVDLENEMTNVALDENGDLIANFDMYFKVRAYYGTTNVLSDSACSVSASCSDPDVTITDTNAKTTGIRVQISSGTHILDTTEVSVTVTHTAYGTRTVIFTLAGVCGGANAVLQELLPSLDAISFARTAAGGLTPSSRDITLSIKKTQGGSTSTQSLSDSGLTIRWSSTSMPASKTGGNGWGNGTATGISWNNITMQIANTVAATNIYIAAFNSAGTLVDRETIPVIKDGNDGDDGDDGVSYCIVFTKAAARVDENNIVTAELAGYAYKYVGGVRSALASTTIRHGYILTDSDTYATTTTNSSGFFDEGAWFNGDDITEFGKNSPSIFAAIVIDGTVVHAEMITISVKGGTGNRGKVGRFFYYAGAWNDFASTDIFLVNDAQAPYFYYDNNYWVFNPETTGTYTKQNMGTPSSSSSNWELMTNDFKYLITEAIFGSYAHFGSFIVNGDWMISTNGTINGVLYVNGQNFTYNEETKPAYMWFDASNPSNNTGHNFVPNFAINGLTGQGMFGGGKIRFNANGGGQLANGKIVWNENGVGNLAGGNVAWDANGNLTIVGNITANNGTFNGVIKTPYREESTWYTTLEKGGCIRIGNASQGLSLPSWNSLDGVELDVMNNTDQTTYVGTSLTDENGNGIGIVLRHYKLATVRLQAGSRCKLKAIPYTKDENNYVVWLILNEGNFDIYSLKDYNNNNYYVARDKSITPIPI